jgi:hypothetical protein
MPLAYVRDSLAAVLDVLRDALTDPYIAQRSGPPQSRAPPGVPCDSSATGVNGARGDSGFNGDDAAMVEAVLVPRTAAVSGRETASEHGTLQQRVAFGMKAGIAAQMPAHRLLTTKLSWSGMQVARVLNVIATSITAP